MNILVLANHYAVASGRYIADAFRRLGHDVSTNGPEHGTRIEPWGMDVAERHVWKPALRGAPYDLIIVADSDEYMLDAVQSFESVAPMVVWGVDNHVRDYRRPWFDHYFLAHYTSSVMPWQDDMRWLPCAYDPTVFEPSPVPYSDRDWDVAMIGVMYESRWRAVDQLRNAGLKVVAGTGLLFDDMADVYQNARVSLITPARNDLAMRMFETAACGCALVLTDAVPDARLMDWPVAFEPDWVTACLNAQALTDADIAPLLTFVQPHTWDERCRVVLDWYNNEK
jgi:hypothetical protein